MLRIAEDDEVVHTEHLQLVSCFSILLQKENKNMAKVKIYQPAKTAMQSGMAKTHSWLLEFIPQKPYFIDNLMGWVGMSETQPETKLYFSTKEEAVTYATRNGLDFEVYEPQLRRSKRKVYADNFAFNKRVG